MDVIRTKSRKRCRSYRLFVRSRKNLRRLASLSCYTSSLLSTIFLEEESARERFFPHPLHVKMVCPSLRQSASRPRRINFSPHRHPSSMLSEQVIKRSGTTSETCCMRHSLSRNPHRAALDVIIGPNLEHRQVCCSAFMPNWSRKFANRERGVAKVRLKAEKGRNSRRREILRRPLPVLFI
jgi:hypothetical protein